MRSQSTFEVVRRLVCALQQQQGYRQIEVYGETHLVRDLGFTSLDIAQLIAMLEDELGIEPFANGATLDQVGTAGDLAQLYMSTW